MTRISRLKCLELPDSILKSNYTIVEVKPDLCESKTSKIYRRLTALKAFEGKSIAEALHSLRGSDTTRFGMFDMRCHVARKRIIVSGIDVFGNEDGSPRIADANAGLVYNWSGDIVGHV